MVENKRLTKKINIHGKDITLYSVDGNTWFSNPDEPDLRERMLKEQREAFLDKAMNNGFRSGRNNFKKSEGSKNSDNEGEFDNADLNEEVEEFEDSDESGYKDSEDD
jgi:hypothetical protein